MTETTDNEADMSGRKVWTVLLAIWLILWALLQISNFKFELSNVVMGLLAAAAGIALILDR